MIVFDTETTGFTSSTEAPLKNQPKIIELFALKLDDNTLEETGSISLLINPGESLSEEIVKVTGITDDMLKGQPSFAAFLPKIQEFWLGERWAVGHNVTFDLDMIEIELRRLGMQFRFPWTPRRLCTVEASEHYHGRRLKLIDLHTHLFGKGFESAHRAENDVRATVDCLREMHRRGDIDLIA